jgi:branched-chain amino acid transport system permease protein
MARTITYKSLDIGFSLAWLGYIVFLLVAPLIFSSNFGLTVLSQIGTVIIATLSYNMLLGQTGMLSFGHAVYGGMGGFIAIHAMNLVAGGQMVCPTSLIPLVGGLGGAFFGVVFGWVTTKKSGTTFAMITLGIGELVASAALTFPEFFGGEAGITTNRVMGHAVFGITYGPQRQVYYLIAIWLVICTVAMYAFTRTPLGRIANAVRDNPERCAFVGYDTQKVRFLVVVLAAFFAGIAGGLGAINFEIVSSENVGALRSGSLLLFTFLGGVGSFVGPILGAVVYVFSLELLSTITQAWPLYVGLLFLLIVMYAPGGLWSLVQMNMRIIKFRLFKQLLRPYAIAIVAALPAFLGITTLIELIYARQLDVGGDSLVHIWGVPMNVTSPIPWIVALVVAVVGFVLFRLAARSFAAEWGRVHVIIAERMAGRGVPA